MNLQVKNLSFGFNKNKLIFKDISFNLYENDILVILGPNGVGKTTLVKCIMNEIKGSVGEIFFDEIEINKLSYKEKSHYIGFVNSNRQNINKTVLEYLELSLCNRLAFYERPNLKHIEEIKNILIKFNMIDYLNRNMSTLSDGEYKIINIIAVMIQNPKVIIMDEPCSSLDPNNQKKILKFIKEISNDKIVIVISHNPQHIYDLDAKALFLSKLDFRFYDNLNDINENDYNKYFEYDVKIFIEGERKYIYVK